MAVTGKKTQTFALLSHLKWTIERRSAWARRAASLAPSRLLMWKRPAALAAVCASSCCAAVAINSSVSALAGRRLAGKRVCAASQRSVLSREEAGTESLTPPQWRLRSGGVKAGLRVRLGVRRLDAAFDDEAGLVASPLSEGKEAGRRAGPSKRCRATALHSQPVSSSARV